MRLFYNISYYFFNKKYPGFLSYDEYVEYRPYRNLFYIEGDKLVYDVRYDLLLIIDKIFIRRNVVNKVWDIRLSHKKILENDDRGSSNTQLGLCIKNLLKDMGDENTVYSKFYTTNFIRNFELHRYPLTDSVAKKLIAINDNLTKEELSDLTQPLIDDGYYNSLKTNHMYDGKQYSNYQKYRYVVNIHSRLGSVISLSCKPKDMIHFKASVNHLIDNIKILHPDYKFNMTEGGRVFSLHTFTLEIYKYLK